MARKPRIELEGGLYHVIARGNARQDIFHSREDQLKFISLLEKAKHKLGFFLYGKDWGQACDCAILIFELEKRSGSNLQFCDSDL